MPPLPSLSDIKTYLSLTSTASDTLLDSLRANAITAVERDTGRTFASSSNVTTRYSTEGQTALIIHDRPYVDASRVVSLAGVTQTEGTTSWFLPDRRDNNIVTTIQFRYFDTSRPVRDFNWFDGNHDNPRYGDGAPNDLVITGIIGHPFPAADVCWAVKFKWAVLYWEARSGASGVVSTPVGETIDIEGESLRYEKFIDHWRIRTAVANV